MGFKSKAAVAVSGALTAGAFATLAGASPAGAATFGTEQSENGVVFSIASNSAIVGASHPGQNTEFARTQQGNRVTFRTGNNQCVTDGFGGLSLQHCNNSHAQTFDLVGFGQYVALQNEASHQYVTEHGTFRQITTENVRRDRRGQLDFSRAQQWKWTTFNVGGPGGGPGGGGPGHPVTASSATRVSNVAAPGNGNPPTWAHLGFDRRTTVKLQGPAASFHCGGPGSCYAYTATMADSGTLTTVPHSLTPNQSFPFHNRREAFPSVNGTYHGTADVTFYATSDHPTGHFGNQDDHGNLDNPADSIRPFFGPSTQVRNVTVTSYDYEFATSHQNWRDRSFDHGNQPGDGNIDGH
jgi:hypothetical protein